METQGTNEPAKSGGENTVEENTKAATATATDSKIESAKPLETATEKPAVEIKKEVTAKVETQKTSDTKVSVSGEKVLHKTEVKIVRQAENLKEKPIIKTSVENINGKVTNSNTVINNNAAIESGALNTEKSVNLNLKQESKDAKNTKRAGSVDEVSQSLNNKNKTVQSKAKNQNEHNSKNESNSQKDFAFTSKNSKTDKFQNINIHNTQTSKIKEGLPREFSSILERPEKIIKTTEIVKEFSQFIKKKESTKLVLQLDPAKLGKVKITLDVVKDTIKAHIEVENNAAKQAVQTNMHELYSQLNKSGINLGTVNITLHEGGNKEAKQFSNKRKNNNSLKSKEDFIEEEENQTARKLGYNTYEFLA